MKIFETKLRESYGKLIERDSSIIDRLDFCIIGLRRFFDIPTKVKLKYSDEHYSIAVYDRKIKEALKIRINPKNDRKIQPEAGEGWVNIRFYREVRVKMLELFESSGKKYLYVRMEED